MNELAETGLSAGQARAVAGLDGRKLRWWRTNRAMLTQAELADRVGMSRSEISHLENGKRQPLVKTLRDLCTALECTAADLMEEESHGEESATAVTG